MDSFEEQLLMAASIYNSRDSHVQMAFPLDALFSLFNTALTLWVDKNKTKYIDQMISLRKQWNDEYSRSDRSRMALDQIQDQINILQIAFETAVASGGST